MCRSFLKISLCVLCALLVCCAGNAQVPAAIAPIPKLQFLDVNGKPLVGGCVFTYVTGTTTPQATYTDATGTAPNTNPVILDSGGRASIWLGSAAYKIAVWSSGGVACASGIQQYSIDGITAANLNSAGQLISAAANPAGTGFIRMANGDLVNWRNAANTLDIGFSQGGAATALNGNIADILRYGNAAAGGLQAQRYVDFSAAPAQTGVLAGGNNVCLVAARNAAGTGDVCAILVNSSNVLAVGGASGVSINGTGIVSVTSISSASSNPAQVGLVRAADSDTAVAFRNHANTADIGALQKDSSDVVHLGGTPGASTNGPFQVSGTLAVTGNTTVPELIVNSGVSVQSTGFKHFRLANGTSCTTPGAQGSQCTTGSIALPVPAFPDSNYTLMCIVEGPATASPVIQGVGSKTPSSFTLSVLQVGTAAASYGQADCIAIHD